MTLHNNGKRLFNCTFPYANEPLLQCEYSGSAVVKRCLMLCKMEFSTCRVLLASGAVLSRACSIFIYSANYDHINPFLQKRRPEIMFAAEQNHLGAILTGPSRRSEICRPYVRSSFGTGMMRARFKVGLRD